MATAIHRSRRPRRRILSHCAALEPRTLLSGGPDPEVTINGTAGNDLIVIERAGPNMLVTVNGTFHDVPATVLSIRINARGGNDEIRLDNTQRDVNIFGEGGDDRLIVTQPSGRLDNLVASDLTFDGGTGNDLVQLWDDRTPAGSNFTYVVNSGFVQRPGGASPVWIACEKVELRAGDDANRFTFESTSATTGVEVFAAGGADHVEFGIASHNLDPYPAPVTLHGGAGDDSLTLDDTNNPFFDDWTIASQSVQRERAGNIIYDDVAQLTLHAGPGGNQFDVHGVSAGTSVVIRAGDGDDDVHVAPTFQWLAFVQGALDVSGGVGFDALYFDDAANDAGDNYVVAAETLTGPFSGQISYAEFDRLTLRTGGGDDRIDVPSTPATTDLAGDNGNDAYTIGAGNLDAIRGTVFVEVGISTPGSGTADSVTINNAAEAAPTALALNGAQFSRNSEVRVDLRNVELFTLNAGSGADVISATATPDAAPRVTLRGGGGNDAIHLTGPYVFATVDGQGGANDSLTFHPPHSGDFSIRAASISSSANALNYAGLEYLEFHDNLGVDVITVHDTNATTPLAFVSDLGLNLYRVHETRPLAPVSFLSEFAPYQNQVEVNLDGLGAAEVRFNHAPSLSALHVGTGGRAVMQANGSRQLSLRGLSVDPGGVLDLADNEMLVHYVTASPIDIIKGLIATAHAAGAWTGPGITSSAAAVTPQRALGYGELLDLGGMQNAVLVRYTRYGDANLDRVVNLNDFNRLAANFGQPGRHWHHGNFNYDANVNLNDFNLLAANFGAAAGIATAAHDDDSDALQTLLEGGTR